MILQRIRNFFSAATKANTKSDPFHEREAEKYENPIPSREYILETLGELGPVLTQKQLAAELELESEEQLEALRRRLRAMERDGQLIRNRRGGYGVVKKMDLIRGRVIGHADGFGFLVPDDGGDDLFISERRMRGLLHGDRVVVRVAGIDRRGRREAAPVEVLERANSQIVGRYHFEHGVALVIASNKRIAQDIMIPPEHRGGALDGQIVVAELIEQPTWRSGPIGKIVEVLGEHMAPGMEIDVAIRAHEIPEKWPVDVEGEIAHYTGEVPEAAKQGREDLRDVPLVTIDGEDSRDFDDAVYCEPHGKGWRLLVAIADVSHYVKPNTALDREAEERGNSVYFPGRVVPMLPEILSNGLCSLNPQVDRLCMVCEMIIGPNGKTRKSRFFEGVMRSAARLTYTEVAAMVVDRKMDMRGQHEAVVPHLDNLYELYKVLAEARKKRGTIEFDTTETKIVFGEHKKIDRIVPVMRNDAHRLIEECMIAANVATATFLEKKGVASVYRVHAGPSEEKLEGLRAFLGEFGLQLGGRKSPEPKHYAKLIEAIRERPDAHMIETVLLRSLSQAMYCPDNSGHFGLAFDAYTHFTSPIRRYPDLLVHRAIRHVISGKDPKRFVYHYNDMEKFGEHCSMTERRADDATRDVVDWLKCEYLQDKVGEEFKGRVTSVTGFGIFVELDDLFVEGLVHITALGSDYYHHDAVNHRLVGERSGRMFRLADEVRVKVVRVDLDDKKIDFELVDGTGAAPPPSEKKKSRGGKRGGKSADKKGAKSSGGERRGGGKRASRGRGKAKADTAQAASTKPSGGRRRPRRRAKGKPQER